LGTLLIFRPAGFLATFDLRFFFNAKDLFALLNPRGDDDD
jgi:hypothetical protein